MNLSDIHLFDWMQGRKDVKVLRHNDRDKDLWALRHDGRFQQYQNEQSRDVFGKAKFVVSFIAERGRYAKFVGVWSVDEKHADGEGCRYVTTELPGYESLAGRLVIDWGDSARAWAQWMHEAGGNKPVMEILPPNYVKEFPGFYNFTLTHAELAQLIANPDSNREWQRMLSSVSGIYVILHKESGRQYVGSAYGENGVWGRWANYAKAPFTGGNVQLEALLAEFPEAYKDFQFALLRVLESGATRDDVLAHEGLVKQKLGSRIFGLNKN